MIRHSYHWSLGKLFDSGRHEPLPRSSSPGEREGMRVRKAKAKQEATLEF